MHLMLSAAFKILTRNVARSVTQLSYWLASLFTCPPPFLSIHVVRLVLVMFYNRNCIVYAVVIMIEYYFYGNEYFGSGIPLRKLVHAIYVQQFFTAVKNDNFQLIHFDFFIFLLKTYIVGTR